MSRRRRSTVRRPERSPVLRSPARRRAPRHRGRGGHPGADDDVRGPHRRRQPDEHETERVALDLSAAENDHTGDREQQCDRVARRARGHCGHGDRAEELDRHRLAEIDAVDRQVEEHVHQRGRHPECRRGDELGTGPSFPPGPRDGHERQCRTDHAEPGDGLWFDLVEQADGDHRPHVLGDGREDEEGFGLRGVQPPVERIRRARSSSGRAGGSTFRGRTSQRVRDRCARSRPTAAGS